jgi:hypothetical protein
VHPTDPDFAAYPAVVTNVRALYDVGVWEWLITIVSTDATHNGADTAYQIADTRMFRDAGPSLTLDTHGPAGTFWPQQLSTDHGNRLSIGSDGGLYLADGA